nr:hypothetical protein [Tanacetum cinerariifolium]
MTLDIHNWSSSANQEVQKIAKDDIDPIVNQVDARVQNFKIQFLKEEVKFARDFKSLAKEADASLNKHKALEFEIKRLLRLVFCQDIMFIVQHPTVVELSDLQTELNVPPKVVEINDLSNPITSNSVPITIKANVVKNDKVIAPGMFRINPFKTSTEDKFLPNKQGVGAILFSVGQFCDSNLEVAFRRNTYFVRNFEGVDVLKGNCTINLYTINLHDMASASLICLIAHATSTKSLLWHQRLSHLNFDTINDLAKNDLISDLPRLKYYEEHLCPSYKAPEVIKTFLKKIIVLLEAPVIIVKTNNGTKFKNHVLKEYFDSVGISHQSSLVRTPQQNGVVERRNRTLVEVARTMLIFSCASLSLWAKAIATACYTQNCSIIHRQFRKTPYELINSKKPDISFLHVFGALCYPKNDHEDIGKLGAKSDISFFIGYSANSCAYKVYKKGQGSSGLDLTYALSTITPQKPTEPELDLLFEAMFEEPALTPTNSSSQATDIPNTLQDVDKLDQQQQHVQQQDDQAQLQLKTVANNVTNTMSDGDVFDNPFAPPSTSAAESSSS